MLRMAMSGLMVAGVIAAGWAIAGENCGKSCDKTRAVAAAGEGCCAKKAQLSAEATDALQKNAAWQKADDLLKSWSDVPAKLVALKDEEKAELESAGEKMAEHPSAEVMKASIEFVRDSLRMVARIDKTAQELCASQAKLTGEPTAAEGGCPKAAAAQAEGKVCPKTMAAAKLRMEQSAGLIIKANQLIGAATATGCGKGEGVKALKVSATEGSCAKKADGCCEKKTAAAKADDCCAKKTAAAAEGECAKKAAAVAGASTTQPAITLVKDEAGKGECVKSAEKADDGCCAKKAAMAEAGEKACPKSLAEKADALISQSGKILAQWQAAQVTLAVMDSASRERIELAAAGMNKCPAGSLMPETLATTRELLNEAVRLTAQCQAECSRTNMAREIPAEFKELMQARTLLINAAINVLERTSTVARPSKQMAMAQ